MKRRKRGITRLEKKVLEILYFTNMDYTYTQPRTFRLVDLVYHYDKAYPNYYKDSHVCYATLRHTLNQLYRKGMIDIANKEQWKKDIMYAWSLPELVLTSKALKYCEEQNFVKFSPSLYTENKLHTLPEHLRRLEES